jgi:hypothetical protein
MTTIRPVFDDVLDSLEAELATFRNPDVVSRASGDRPPPAADHEKSADDGVPEDSAIHFVIAAYRAC